MARRIRAREVLRLRSVNGLSQNAIARCWRRNNLAKYSRPRLTNPGRPILANTPASMTFLSHSYIPSGWIPLTFTAWGTASTE